MLSPSTVYKHYSNLKSEKGANIMKKEVEVAHYKQGYVWCYPPIS